MKRINTPEETSSLDPAKFDKTFLVVCTNVSTCSAGLGCAMTRIAELSLATIGTLWLSVNSATADFKVGMVWDRGGKDDKSVNSSAFAGATEAKNKLGVFLKYVEARF